jgi:hypothetical protein
MSENSPLTPEQFLAGLDSGACWTVRYIDPSGFEVQLSIEAPSGTEAMRKGQLVIERLKEIQCSPIVHSSSIPTSNEPDREDESICPIHHTPLRLYQKNGHKWYAHKTKEGQWCRGV